MNNSGPLAFDAVIRDLSYTSTLTAMERRMMGFTANTVRETGKIESSLKLLGSYAAGAFAFQGLAQLPAQIFKVRSEFQSLEISLTTMLRSKAKANALLSDVSKFAAASPFGLKEAGTGAKQLLAYGFAAKELVPTLRRLGDISAGLGLPLERLVFLYGTAKTSGRLFAQDLNQFIGSGIPLLGALADQFGVAETEVRKLVEEGKVGFPEVKKAIESLTSGSGIFTGTLDAQSKSLAGLKERLSDAYDLVLNEIGKKNENLIGSVLTGATEAVQNYQQFVNVLTVIAATYGTYRLAVLLASQAQKGNLTVTAAQAIANAQATNATGFLTLSQTRAAAATALTTRAQLALNAAMRVNPFVLITTALVALVTAYFAFREELIEVKTGQELLADATQDASGKFNAQKAEVNSLIKIIQSQSIAESQRLKAYERLKDIAPSILNNLDFQKSKTADLTKTLNEYLESLQKQIKLESVSGRLKEAYDQDGKIDTELAKARADYLAKRRAAQKSEKSQVTGGTFAVVGNTSSDAAREADEALQKLNQLAAASIKSKDAIKVIGDEFEGVYKGNSKEAIQAHITELELAASTITNKLSPAYKQNEDALNGYRKQLEDANAAQKKGVSFSEQLATAQSAAALRVAKGLATTDNQIDAVNKKAKDLAGDATRGGKEKADLEQLSKELDKLQGKKTKAEKDAEKVGPFGSLSYWDNIIKKAEEALEKTNITDKPNIARQKTILDNAKRKAEEIRAILEAPAESIKYYENLISNAQNVIDITPKTDTGELEKQKQIIVFAQAELEQIRKTVAVKSFDEELDEKKKLYELYQRFIDAYGQESADKQFANLIGTGKSYVDFLNTEIAKLEKKREGGTILSEPDAQNLGNLVDQRNEATGKKSSIDVFRESLEKAQREASSLTDYLEILKQKQAELNAADNSPSGIAKRLELAQKEVETQAQLRDQVRGFLTDIDGSSEQQFAIQKRYVDLRTALDKEFNDKRSGEYLAASAKINAAEKQDLTDFQQRKAEQSKEYQELTKVILEEGQKQLKIEIARKRAAVAAAKRDTGANSEEYKKQQKDLNNLLNEFEDAKLRRINEFAALAGELGGALSDLGGIAGEAARLISGLASGVGLLTQALKENVSDADRVQIGIQAIVNLVGVLASSAKERKAAEKDYYDSIIGAQQEYNLLLNEQIGLRSEASENVFVKDYAGRFKDNFSKLGNAQKQLDNSFDKLQKGRLLSGQKNVLDGAAIGKAAIAGAAAGTALLPGIGTVIGAGLGAVIGLFGGKKKKNVYQKSLLEEYPDLIEKGADGTERLNIGLAEILIKNGQIDEATRKTLESTVEWQKQVDETKAAIKGLVEELAGALGDKLRDNLVEAFRDGTSAAEAFRQSVTEVIEDIVSKMLFSAIFKTAFDDLEKDYEKSLNGGDGKLEDDTIRFYDKAPELTQKYFDALKAVQTQIKGSGIDLFKPEKDDPKGLTGAVKGVSEETASILAGQINAIRITQAETGSLVRQSLFELTTIRLNTGTANKILTSMDEKLSRIANTNDPLRGKGVGPL